MSRFEPLVETKEQAQRIAAADAALAEAPDDLERIVEAALAREEVWRYREAIALYTRGESLAPEDYRFPLGRAHRLMRLRRFDEALADVDRSYRLDPYGFNTAYLRALTRYLKGSFTDAADEYGRAMALAEDADACALADRGEVPGDPRHCMWIRFDDASRIAITAWRYRALRRAGRHDEARALLETVEDGLELSAPPADRFFGTIIRPDSNDHYYRCLLFYRGVHPEEHVLDEPGGQWPTLAYGVAVWHLVEGRRDRAVEVMNAVVSTPHWARLGHVAAEADLSRLSPTSGTTLVEPVEAFGTETELRRDLGRATAIAVVIGTVVGSGIFVAPSIVLARVGSPTAALVVWLVSGLCALFGILCYAELSAMMPRSGGPFVYLRMAFPPWVAFLFGWTSFFVLQPSALALISDVLVTHAAHLAGVPEGFAPWTRKGLQAGIIVFLAAANYRGVRVGGFIQLLFTLLKVAGLAAIIFAGLALGDPPQSASLPGASGIGAVVAFGAAMIAAMQAHYGFENATFVAEEIRDPRRNLPIALVAGMTSVIALYLLVNVALFSALPYQELVASESPTALAMERTLGAAGGTLLAAIVVFSTFGSLNGAMLASPRLFYAMGKARLFFRFTTRVHPEFKTPHLSIVALTVIALGYVAGLGTWERVTEAVSVAFAGFLSLAVIALFVLRRKFPDADRPYRVTGYPFTPLLYLAIILAYTVTIVASNYQTTLIGVAIAAAGLVFYPLFSRAG